MFDAFSKLTEAALSIRIEFSCMKYLDSGSPFLSRYECSDIDIEPKEAAWTLGFDHFGEPVPIFFMGTVLESVYVEGQRAGAYDSDLSEEIESRLRAGSQENWDTLSPDEQDAHWDEFHERCLTGTADDMTFYDLMMSIHQIGYVGH